MRGAPMLGLGLLLFALDLAACPATAADRVTIATGSFGNAAFLPFDVAEALGALREPGLEVEVQRVQSGSHAATAVLTGSADFAVASLDHVIKANLQGRSLKMIASFSEVPGMRLLVRSDLRNTVKEARDLKGRPVGVTGLGTSTHLVLTHVLSRAGLRPAEIFAVPLAYRAMAAALTGGKVDGLVTGGVTASQLLAAGQAYVLVDLTTRDRAEAAFGGPYQETGLLTRAEVLAARPELCRKVVRAVVVANRWIATHTPEEIAALWPDTVVRNRSLFAEAIAPVHDGFSKDGRIQPRAVETILAMHRTLGLVPADKHVDAAALYDNSFVEQVLAGRPE